MADYTLHLSGGKTLYVDHNSEGPNIDTRGQTVTYEFWFNREDLNISNAFTQTTDESYGSITIEPGGELIVPSGVELRAATITNNGTLTNNGTVTIDNRTVNDEFNDAQALGDYAGKYTTVETLTSEQNFREFVPSGADIESLVIGIEPDADLSQKSVIGVWGLVDSVDDTRNMALNTHNYGLTVRVLGEFSEYSSVTDVKNNLEV